MNMLATAKQVTKAAQQAVKEGWLAAFGQNIQYVAFFAHFFAAGWLMDRPWIKDKLMLAATITIVAGIKEFWYDATYEKNPPQTFLDNAEDWIGWSSGAWVTLIILAWEGVRIC